jgi:hypothetical protein
VKRFERDKIWKRIPHTKQEPKKNCSNRMFKKRTNVPPQRVRRINGQQKNQDRFQFVRALPHDGFLVGRKTEGKDARAVFQGVPQVLVPRGVAFQARHGPHDQTLSGANQVGNGRKDGRYQYIPGRSRYRSGIVARHVEEHAPVEKDFGQRAHGIRHKDINKGNGSRGARRSEKVAVVVVRTEIYFFIVIAVFSAGIAEDTRETVAARIDQFQEARQDDLGGVSQPPRRLEGKQNSSRDGSVKCKNSANGTSPQPINPNEIGGMQ